MRLVETLPFRRSLTRLLSGRNRRLLDNRAGVAVLVALMAVPLIAVLALAVEVTSWAVTQQEMQRAADVAVLAAAESYNAGLSVENAAFNGAYLAELNGQAGVPSTQTRSWSGALTASLGDNTITIQKAPTPITTGATDFQAIISTSQAVSFSSMFLGSAQTIKASAIAEVVPSSGNGKYCVLQMSTQTYTPTAADNWLANGVSMYGGSTVNASSCGIYANAGGTSMEVSTGFTLNAKNVATVGTYSCSNATCNVTNLLQNQQPLADPYNWGTGPLPSVLPGSVTVGACTVANTNKTFNGGTAASPLSIPSGTYCGYLAIGTSATTYATMSGLYIINTEATTTYPPFYVGIGTSVTNAPSTTVLVTSTTANPTGTVGYPSNFNNVVAIENGTTFNITAPTTTSTAGIAGVAIWVNPNDPATNNGVFTLQEGSTSSITGAVVVPTLGAVLTNGANSSSNCFQLVAYTVLVSSGATLGFSNTGCTAAGALPIGGTPKVTLAR